MQVILLDKVENLGGLGELVDVKPGYARNFLLLGGHAKIATEKNVKEFETLRVELEKASVDRLTVAQGRAKQLNEMSVTITAKAGTEGKLFGSIGAETIAQALTDGGVEVSKREIRLPQGRLRNLGDHHVDLHLHTDVSATAVIVITAAEGQVS